MHFRNPSTGLGGFNTSSVVFVLWVGILSSVLSTPWTPPAAFHSRSHWRLLVGPRKSGAGRRQTPRKHGFCSRHEICGGGSSSSTSTSSSSSLSSTNGGFDIIDKIAQALGIDQSFDQKQHPMSTTQSASKDPKGSRGKVVRTAARSHQSGGGSIPSSRHYTTRKPSLPMIAVSDAGVTGDYNHYRTVALRSTPDRAISILTRDIGSYIKTLDGGLFASRAGGNGGGYSDGDLGENVLVEGVDFGFFKVGQRYRFSSSRNVDEDGGGAVDGVVVEITEPMEPCPNLCKLPYINDPSATSPKERVARCQYFIQALGQREGMRGWYAKVIQDGFINVGDSLSAIGVVA